MHRFDQFLQIFRQCICIDQLAIQHFLQFFHFQLQKIRRCRAIGGHEIMGAPCMPRDQQAAVRMALDQFVHVAITCCQFDLGPCSQTLGNARSVACDNPAGAIPAAAIQRIAKGATGANTVGDFQQRAVMRARRDGFDISMARLLNVVSSGV